MVTDKIKSHPNITVYHEEVTSIPTDGTVIFASGPLTSETLGNAIRELTGNTGFISMMQRPYCDRRVS